MTNKQTLLDLADRVEAGDNVRDDVLRALGWKIESSRISKKITHCRTPDNKYAGPYRELPDFLTSLDATKALHDAVLLGWGWTFDAILPMEVEACVYPTNCAPERITIGRSPIPAAAWVAAILRAKAGEQNDE